MRALRAELKGLGSDRRRRYEIDVRLAQKEKQFQEALVLAADVRLEAVADDDLVVAGQPVPIRGDRRQPRRRAGDRRGDAGRVLQSADRRLRRRRRWRPRPRGTAASRPSVPADARLTAAHFKYATTLAQFVLDPDVPSGLPFRPTPFVANVALVVGGEAVPCRADRVQSRSEGNLYSGEKRAELHVVPKFAVSATPGNPRRAGGRAARRARHSRRARHGR